MSFFFEKKSQFEAGRRCSFCPRSPKSKYNKKLDFFILTLGGSSLSLYIVNIFVLILSNCPMFRHLETFSPMSVVTGRLVSQKKILISRQLRIFN